MAIIEARNARARHGRISSEEALRRNFCFRRGAHIDACALVGPYEEACRLLSTSTAMRVVLTIEDRQVAVTRGETILGRDASCDVLLLEKSVSRRHAALVLNGGSAVLRDLGSRNGTWVNGLRLASGRRLRPGDRIRLGIANVLVTEASDDAVNLDDGWLAVQSALLLCELTAHRIHDADEILFRIAETIETRTSLGERFGDEVCDGALAAVIDYATARRRPGWTRWALGVLHKLGTSPGDAVRRSVEHAGSEELLRTSGTVPIARAVTVKGRRVG